MIRRPPRSTLFPYTTSSDLRFARGADDIADEGDDAAEIRLEKLRRYRRQLEAPSELASLIRDRKSTRLNSSHGYISYAVFCLKKKKKQTRGPDYMTDITWQV